MQAPKEETKDASTKPSNPPEEAPDPEEDDLDDLDDMLDEFSSTKLDSKKDAPTASGPGRPTTQTVGGAPDPTPDEFNKQLQEQMAALMGEVDESPEMRQQMEEMMRELGTGAESSTAAAGPSAAPEETFQETIRKTMERMQASGDQAAAAVASDDGDDILAQMLKEMQGGSLDGAGSEEDLSKMLMGMMEQLTNKDILYEPMKELHDKFPVWMSKNRSTAEPDDLLRYEEQQQLVGEIVSRFEKRGYSDDNAADREFIVERMQKMQAAGSPPADLVGDMKDAQEALGDLDSGCLQQ
ncbi:Peroxisome chaperone and import receptor [Trapelia coarctata]|nr:Peroxisome chaperone and import receptor [Trapelia coarctata]